MQNILYQWHNISLSNLQTIPIKKKYLWYISRYSEVCPIGFMLKTVGSGLQALE